MVLAFLLALTRIGIIGADTYHSVAFTKYLNGPDADPAFADFRVTAVYLEAMAFMTAARMSAANGGRAVKIADVLAEQGGND